MMAIWMLFLVFLVAGIVWVLLRGRTIHAAMDTPLDILKKRYARGELSKEEFERMKNDLRN